MAWRLLILLMALAELPLEEGTPCPYKESVARICGEQDMASARRLVAVGFSQLKDENCDWFEMAVSLRKFSSCAVQLHDSIRGIVSPQTHFCVEPISPPRALPGGCIRCLRGSPSVLHAVLPDGGLCAAAVAMSTASNCHSSGPRLYYTSLVRREMLDFIQDAQYESSDTVNAGN